MKLPILIVGLLLFSVQGNGQVQEQDFCAGNDSGSYFPLDIKKKKIIWGKLYYTERNTGLYSIHGKEYHQIVQKWSEGSKDTIYLREEGQVVYQLDENYTNESVRLNTNLEAGNTWKGNGTFSKYKILSYNATLKTPFCTYSNLLALQATYALDNTTYTFYYLKGYGYVGAKTKKGVISYVTPNL